MKYPSVMAGITAALLSTACGDLVSPVNPSPVDLGSPIPTPAGPGSGGAGTAAPSGSAADAVPFNGRFDGTQTVTPLTPPLASVETNVTGTATHLGRFTMALPHTVNFATRAAQGTCTIVAANGDTLVASFTGQAQLGAIVSIVEQATITGGTGRFAGATGRFTIERRFDPAAGTTAGSFEGTISAPGAGS
jgi:hypothetical protein